ncbi:MAG: VOC family protein [Candidatus Binatia bacterium]
MEVTQIGHVHVYVSDRPKAVDWLKTVWGTDPIAEDHEMSLFVFGSTQLVVNDVDEDILSTIAFISDDCERDYREAIAKGAVAVHEPQDKPWGVKAAFLEGPGKLIFEIEETLPR